MQHDVLILPDRDTVEQTAIELLVAAAHSAVELDGRFVLALSGGRSLEDVYRRLAHVDVVERIPWERTWVLFADERCVGPADPSGNYRRIREVLLDHVPIPPEQVLRIEGEHEQASRAAHFYEQRMRELFPQAALPAIDVAILGLGANGATASLHPGADALRVEDRWVTADYRADLGAWSVTLTLPALRAAHQLLFVVTGVDMADRVAASFADPRVDIASPIQQVVPTEGHRIVLVDADAASRLSEPTGSRDRAVSSEHLATSESGESPRRR